MKVVLINPLYKHNTSGCKLIPLGLAYLHAAIRDNHDVEIINLDYDDYNDSILEIVSIKKADVIGFSIYEGLFHQTALIARYVKRLNSKIFTIAGGPFATYACKEIICGFKQFDFVILGEGEHALKELLSVIPSEDDIYQNLDRIAGLAYLHNNEYRCTPINDFDINEVPIPSWDAVYPFPVDEKNHFIPICTSRGCWGNCTFCSFDYKGSKRIRSRSIDNVREEIELLVNEYDQHDFFFSEPNFLYSKQRVTQFIEMLENVNGVHSFGFTTRVDSFLNCKELLNRLVELGCRSIELGIESGSDSQLLRFKKGTTVLQNSEAAQIILDLKERVVGFRYCIDLIFFDPYCTREELLATIDFMYKNKLNIASNEKILYNVMNLFQGTEVRKACISDKLALDSLELPYYDFIDSTVSRTYSFALLFMNKLQPVLNEISNMFDQLFLSNEYVQSTNVALKLKIGKLFYKRDSIVFDYFKRIIICNDNDSCSDVYSKFDSNIKCIKKELENLILLL